jgi:sulfite reductase (ferredoxin)
VGECSAGLFDLIEVDLKSARELREEYRTEDQHLQETLYAITLRSARALLITRGIEAPTDSAVFDNFRKHFIEAGLINYRFHPVLFAAQQKDFAALSLLEDEVFSLLESVENLYRSMDNSLRFAAETSR